MRSIVCNPQLVAGCNHFEEMYVIHRRWYVINPKEDTPAVMPYTLRVITCAYRRLHTNPSDWIKNKTVRRLSYFLVLVTGIEPVRYCYHGILSPGRLPVPPHQRTCYVIITRNNCQEYYLDLIHIYL